MHGFPCRRNIFDSQPRVLHYVENQVLRVAQTLKEQSDLGMFGAGLISEISFRLRPIRASVSRTAFSCFRPFVIPSYSGTILRARLLAINRHHCVQTVLEED